ncbi:unannotated protein [freshwater metagenome]|uniref:Unannotated protein n=1 Tax=freshwater metagenome TaxID=449393 RepID=A0A6J7FDK3_9ZZZZ|nr:DUF2294 family protein [Actinomycetota bacterium]
MAVSPEDRSGELGDARVPTDRERISTAIVHTYKREFGKGPESIRVHIADDTVMALLRGGFSIVEESLRRSGRAEVVRDQRRAFGDMVAPTLAAAVSEVIGREVVQVLADTSQDPDLSVVVFVLARA